MIVRCKKCGLELPLLGKSKKKLLQKPITCSYCGVIFINKPKNISEHPKIPEYN